MKNLIFQYLILSDSVDTSRKDIEGRKRTEVYKEITDISSRSFQIYAKKLGCDYFFTNDQYVTKGHTDHLAYFFEVLRIIYDESFDQYDKVLFLDTDIVCNTEENIFEESDAEVYGVFESDIITSSGRGYNSWDFKESVFLDFQKKFEAHNCPIVPIFPPNQPSRLTIMNTGVLVWNREARIRARECFESWEDWAFRGPQSGGLSVCCDQPFISAQLMKHDFDIEGIDQKWNDTPTHYDTIQEGFKSNFLHYTSGQNKLTLIDHYNKGMFKIFENE